MRAWRDSSREFLLVRRPDESGKAVKQAVIRCSRCTHVQHHMRRGEMTSEEYFQTKGWIVGNNATHDLCPTCVDEQKAKKEKGKVVNMADHTKQPTKIIHEDKPPERVMTREDGRLLIFTIAERWDDQRKSYHRGWSDVRVATEGGVPVTWVAEIRAAHFGDSGIDPGFDLFIEDMVQVKAEMEQLSGQLAKATEAFKSGSTLHTGITEALANEGRRLDEITRQLDGYRNGHGRLFAKVQKLAETAEALAPAVKRAAG